MSISTTAYCDSPTCTQTTTQVADGAITTQGWVTANILSTTGDWHETTTIDVRHFCDYACYTHYLVLNGIPLSDPAGDMQEVFEQFLIDESILKDKS